MNELTREYGGALFALAEEEKCADELSEQIRAIAPLLAADTAYSKLLCAPNIGVAERLACVAEAFDGRVHPYLSSFLKLMTERGYARSIGDCFSEYERLYLAQNETVVAEVKSAVPLTETQKSDLISSLVSRTGKQIRLCCTVDPSLIGGISVSLDGTRLDGSVRAHLDELRRRLSEAEIRTIF